MKKKILTALVIVLVLAVLIAVIGIIVFNSKYIGPREAVEIALAESAVERQNLREVDCEFEWSPYSVWYDVSIDIHGFEYEYSIDAVTGEVLHASSKPD